MTDNPNTSTKLDNRQFRASAHGAQSNMGKLPPLAGPEATFPPTSRLAAWRRKSGNGRPNRLQPDELNSIAPAISSIGAGLSALVAAAMLFSTPTCVADTGQQPSQPNAQEKLGQPQRTPEQEAVIAEMDSLINNDIQDKRHTLDPVEETCRKSFEYTWYEGHTVPESVYSQSDCAKKWSDRVAARIEQDKKDAAERHGLSEEQDQQYQKILQTSFLLMTTNRGALLNINSVSSPKEACILIIADNYNPPAGSMDRCVSDLTNKISELRNDLLSGTKKPENCKEWAISKGATWETAPFNMEYQPFNTANSPEIFAGEVSDAEPSRILVTRDRGGAVAIVNLKKNTVIMNGDKIRVGGSVFGYGVQAGHGQVNVRNWHEQALIVSGACVEPLGL